MWVGSCFVDTGAGTGAGAERRGRRENTGLIFLYGGACRGGNGRGAAFGGGEGCERVLGAEGMLYWSNIHRHRNRRTHLGGKDDKQQTQNL